MCIRDSAITKDLLIFLGTSLTYFIFSVIFRTQFNFSENSNKLLLKPIV
jgi:hypothetical protein